MVRASYVLAGLLIAAAEPSSCSGPGVVSGGRAGSTSVFSAATPGPTNTGVTPGTVLTPSASLTVRQNGQVVQNLDIKGTITVLANDVIIRRVRITTGDYYPIRYFDNDNTGLLVEDSEIIGTSDSVTSAIA